MNSAESLSGWLRLTLIPGIGCATQRKLLAAFGLPEHIFAASRNDLRSIVSDKTVTQLIDTDNSVQVSTALAWATGQDQHLVTLADVNYPQALLQIPDPPTLLYVRGRCELLNCPTLSIVGSRSPTPQGVQNAERFAAALADAGLVIASGLALGIDAAAHRGALSVGGDTIAFIGTGIDRIYPARNHALALEIGNKGCIVSEYPLGTPVTAANFPRRNRLISGISRGVLVVEAATESGSLISARLASEQGREVFAIPGSIHSPQSKGCHKLIKQGAKLVESVQDVLEELCWQSPAAGHAAPPLPCFATNTLLDQIGFDPCALDELAERTNLTAGELSVMLLQLELDGLIACLPGGHYQRLSAH